MYQTANGIWHFRNPITLCWDAEKGSVQLQRELLSPLEETNSHECNAQIVRDERDMKLPEVYELVDGQEEYQTEPRRVDLHDEVSRISYIAGTSNERLPPEHPI